LSGKNKTAKLLLENRADPNVVDKFGGTALGKAKIKDDSALIKMLEEWGARD
jgi:ankyrin repeat protein